MSVATRASDLGIAFIPVPVQNIRMDRIRTPPFAYLLGYLWADGWVSADNSVVSLRLQYEDGLAIKSVMDWTGKWAQNVRTDRASQMLEFRVYDQQFNGLLRTLDYPDKSQVRFDRVRDYLGTELIPYFVHGFFDGDGSVVCHKNGQRQISFAGPYNYDWCAMQSLLSTVGIETDQIARQRREIGGDSSVLRVTHRLNVLRFYRAFVHGHSFGLDRKRTRLAEYAALLKKRLETGLTVMTHKGRYYPRLWAHERTICLPACDTLAEAHAAIRAADQKYQTINYWLSEEFRLIDAISQNPLFLT